MFDPSQVEFYKGVIEHAEKERAQLLKKLEELEWVRQRLVHVENLIHESRILAEVASSPDQEPEEPTLDERKPSPTPKQIGSDTMPAPSEKRVWERAASILAENGNRPIGVPEIARQFHARGWKLSEANGAEVVRRAMRRKPDVFRSAKNGSFELIR